jgi:hypothetical protein
MLSGESFGGHAGISFGANVVVDRTQSITQEVVKMGFYLNFSKDSSVTNGCCDRRVMDYGA